MPYLALIASGPHSPFGLLNLCVDSTSVELFCLDAVQLYRYTLPQMYERQMLSVTGSINSCRSVPSTDM